MCVRVRKHTKVIITYVQKSHSRGECEDSSSRHVCTCVRTCDIRVISGDINQLIFWGYYRSNTTHGNAAVVTMILSV